TPQEIVDAIVDEIWASSCPTKTSTLRSCARSARCFLHRARAHLLREIHLYHPSCSPLSESPWQASEEANGLHCLLSQFHDVFIRSSIPLDCVVRSLHLHGANPGGSDLEEWLNADRRLSDVFAALGRLECLTFRSLNIVGGDTSVPLTPSVKHVAFNRVWSPDARGLAHCLRQFPNMESLHFSACNFPSESQKDSEALVDLGSLREMSLDDIHFFSLEPVVCLLRRAQLQRLSYQCGAVWAPDHPATLFQISRLVRASKSVTDLTVNMCWLVVNPFDLPPLLPFSSLTSLNVTLVMHAISSFRHNTESIQFCDGHLVSFLVDSLSADTTYSLQTFTLSLRRVWYPPHIPQDHRDLWVRIGSSLASPAMPYLARVRVVDRDTRRPVWLCSKTFQDVRQSSGFVSLEQRRVLDMEEPSKWEKSVSPWCMG
ncbi:hypothetical protein BDZ89DRAFT_1060626, partial [Hymenopellis radicata]